MFRRTIIAREKMIQGQSSLANQMVFIEWKNKPMLCKKKYTYMKWSLIKWRWKKKPELSEWDRAEEKKKSL